MTKPKHEEQNKIPETSRTHYSYDMILFTPKCHIRLRPEISIAPYPWLSSQVVSMSQYCKATFPFPPVWSYIVLTFQVPIRRFDFGLRGGLIVHCAVIHSAPGWEPSRSSCGCVFLSSSVSVAIIYCDGVASPTLSLPEPC